MSVLAWSWPKLIVWGNPIPVPRLVWFCSSYIFIFIFFFVFFFGVVRLGSSSISALFRCCQAANTHHRTCVWVYRRRHLSKFTPQNEAHHPRNQMRYVCPPQNYNAKWQNMTNYNKKKNKKRRKEARQNMNVLYAYSFYEFFDICHGNLSIPLIRLLSGQFCGHLTWQPVGPPLVEAYFPKSLH